MYLFLQFSKSFRQYGAFLESHVGHPVSLVTQAVEPHCKNIRFFWFRDIQQVVFVQGFCLSFRPRMFSEELFHVGADAVKVEPVVDFFRIVSP